MKYTDVLIDLDDTLIDTVANTRIVINELYTDYELGKYFSSFIDFFQFYYSNVSRLWELYNAGHITKDTLQERRFTSSLEHIDDMDSRKIEQINADYVERIMKKDLLIEGAIELLDYLKPKFNLHILSNGFTEMQYVKMESAGISSYFDKVILSDKVGVNKPDPRIFEYAVKEIRATKENVIMIGDNPFTDIEGAYNSKIDQIWFNPRNIEFKRITPTYTIRELDEIMKIL